MPPALSARSWIATLRAYHDADDITVSTMSRMLSDIIMMSSPNNEQIAQIIDHHALQLLSSGGFDGRD
jgi:hypothetical protein